MNAYILGFLRNGAMKVVIAVPPMPTSQRLAQSYGCISQLFRFHIPPASKLAFSCCDLAGMEALFSSLLVGWDVLGRKCTGVFCEALWPSSWPSLAADRWPKHLPFHPGTWHFFLVTAPGQPMGVRKEHWVGRSKT